jgi:hypothetical protein
MNLRASESKRARCFLGVSIAPALALPSWAGDDAESPKAF